MQTVHYIRTSSFLLIAIIPISVIGYLLAVDYEDLFYLYEWALSVLIAGAGGMALTGAVQMNGRIRWVQLSVLAFCVHFSVLGLFLGPFTIYPMFGVYYLVTVLALLVYVYTLFKVKQYRSVPVLLMVGSSLMTFYMMFLHMLWGANLT